MKYENLTARALGYICFIRYNYRGLCGPLSFYVIFDVVYIQNVDVNSRFISGQSYYTSWFDARIPTNVHYYQYTMSVCSPRLFIESNIRFSITMVGGKLISSRRLQPEAIIYLLVLVIGLMNVSALSSTGNRKTTIFYIL